MDIKLLEKVSKKYINTTKFEILGLIVNLYLLYSNYRKVFQLDLFNPNLLNQIKKILKTVKADYEIFPDDQKNTSYRIIVYNKDTFDINKLDKTFGKKFAKQLGEFYTCSSNNFSNFDYQISITIDNNKTGTSLYEQMCDKNRIFKNISKHMKILDNIIEIKKKYKIKLSNIKLEIRNKKYTNAY
jgi:hypothetical protein